MRYSYQIVVPAATYAPWLRDNEFLTLFKQVKKNSLVNFYQAYELWSLVEQLEKVNGDVLEVGVWRGSSSIVMGSKLKQLCSEKHVYACDTFEGVVKSDASRDNFYKGGEHRDTSQAFVAQLVEAAGLTNVTLLKGVFPEETGHCIESRQFSLCHIDVDTYISARQVMDWVWQRLSAGGVIIFNDFGFPMTQGITALVNEYRRDSDKMVIHNLNGNGILVKVKV
ncbi:hypothetical protein CHS0354_000450 [Potamilus streckersoni]|uniref:Methyltransferase n=1 Tax=Potamilus streckersoni TaxID=2493646 RepID=A0AAE0T6Q4_9BIVA|nr:hypothetical protein CHS0354_000450 [Potamilus streckersoni]